MLAKLSSETEAGPRPEASAAGFTPPAERWPDRGVYQLWLRVARSVRVRVGRLGYVEFPAGRYVYTGRASRGLVARVLRYVRGPRSQRWHIDYLLGCAGVRVERIILSSPDANEECAVNQAGGGRPWARGFGASDCRCGCRSHLRRLS